MFILIQVEYELYMYYVYMCQCMFIYSFPTVLFVQPKATQEFL